MTDIKFCKFFDSKFEKLTPAVDFENKRVISYSQLSAFTQCQKRWHLIHVDRVKDPDTSISLVFGTSIHEVVQQMLILLFTKTVAEFENFDYKTALRERMRENFKLEIEKLGEETVYENITIKQIAEHYDDGLSILEFLVRKRSLYFSKKHQELIAVESPLFQPIIQIGDKTIMFLGYKDIVLRDKKDGTYLILDIKTSTKGWDAWKKGDRLTTSQLVLYKQFFAKQYNIPVEKIKVKYFIVRRKVTETAEFKVKRIQEFIPPDGPRITKDALDLIKKFLQVFDETGAYSKTFVPMAISGEKDRNCRFCPFSDKEELCPKKNRISNI